MLSYFDIYHFALYILDILVILRDDHATNVIPEPTAKKDIQVDLAGKEPNTTIYILLCCCKIYFAPSLEFKLKGIDLRSAYVTRLSMHINTR